MFASDKFFLFLFLRIATIPLSCWNWIKGKWEKHQTRAVRKKGIRDVPGPFPIKYFGTQYLFTCFGKYTLDEIHVAYKDLERLYGPLCKEEALRNVPVISVFSREHIEMILKSKPKFPLRPPVEITCYYRQSRPDRYTSLGLVNEQGETWQRLRNAFTPKLMSAETILGFYPTLNGVAEDFIDMIRQTRDRSSVYGFEEIAYRVGLETTCTLMLGKRLGFLKPESSCTKVLKLAEAVRVHFTSSRDAFYGLPWWKYMPSRSYNRLVESEELIYSIISDLVDETLREQEGVAQDQNIEAVFNSILRQKDVDMMEKKSAIIDFISAGIHTLGNTVMFLLHMLGRNPEVQKRLYEEVSALAPPRCDITSDQIKTGTYLEAFIMETYRLTPTIPCIARILQEPVDLGEYHLESGTIVLLQTWLAGLKEQNFKDADKCLPERWLPRKPCSPHSNLLLKPFGLGRRSCPAQKFADRALQLLLAKIVREFEIVAEEELVIQFEYILSPKGPVSLIFRDRQDAT